MRVDRLRSVIIVTSFSSSQYWRHRYAKGRNSGAGSHGSLGRYKTSFLNQFYYTHQHERVIDFGSGDGTLAEQFVFASYRGIDPSETVIERCSVQFAHRKGWSFHKLEDKNEYEGKYDLVLSLDVIFHLVEDDVFEAYMTSLFDHASKHVVIYSSDWDETLDAPHVRHRWFSAWIARNRPEWRLVARPQSPYPHNPNDPANTSFAEFHVFALHDSSTEG